MTDTDRQLEGKTALVTGGARRIGRATSLALAGRGANVVVHYNRSVGDAAELVDELTALNVRAAGVQADLGDPQSVATLIARATEAVGPLDILVNNASVFDPTALRDPSPELLDRNVQINAAAPIRLTKDFASLDRGGSVTNMLDATLIGDKTHSAYHESKQMLLDDTERSAVALAPRVRVNAVAPGLILPAPGQDPTEFEALAATNPLSRIGRVEDVVAATLFLITTDFVTGQILFVDGGKHLLKR